ncbi:cupin domain-containing protein [Labrys wisconsinensis]|uniref:Quercetin dioxygenase-like cupin family protein n=1 Tax=Labrys wisconsinensis TaxID=425677 RepID=A0ABU0J3Q2_9HYPH|nr:cupin domain-containing protein [Labrys wisconsinensis]MDQ0467924.1 quercetin dioxygenase-like cupin family protein [Labrys wisconsinensis]
MSDAADPKTQGFVLQLEDGPSYWQPVPANGHVTNKLVPANWDGPFSCGIQEVAPRSFIRKHIHDRHHEAIFVWGGEGKAVVDGIEHPMRTGTIVALPIGVEHMFINEGDEPLRLFWILSPHGIEAFFSQIGRPRTPGEPAPQPFPRPADILEIEARTVFKPGSTV